GSGAGVAAGAAVAGVSGFACGAGSGAFGGGFPDRRSTGGASVSSSGGFDCTTAFFAFTLSPGCQLPTPSQDSFFCSSPVTVNKPRYAPVFSPSYTIPDSSAMGTGLALYADAS